MDIMSFLVYCFIVTHTPGPSNLVILSLGTTYGFRKTGNFIIGSAMSFTFLLLVSASLNRLILTFMPTIIPWLQIIGSLYILYLAYKMSGIKYVFDRKFQMREPSESKPNSQYIDSGSEGRPGAFEGFMMQLINPKVIMFTLTIYPSFILPYYSDTRVLLGFGLLIGCIGLSAYSLWGLMGSFAKNLFNRHQRLVNLVLAVFLVYSAYMVSGLSHVIGR